MTRPFPTGLVGSGGAVESGPRAPFESVLGTEISLPAIVSSAIRWSDVAFPGQKSVCLRAICDMSTASFDCEVCR